MNTTRTCLTTQNPQAAIAPRLPAADTINTANTPAPLINALRQQIRRMETAGRPNDTQVISTGCSQLDQWLPGNGLATGTITEWLVDQSGGGAELLSLLAAKEACQEGGTLVIVDSQHTFFPPAAAAWGINLENVIVLRDKRSTSSSRRSSSNSCSVDADFEESSDSALLWAIDQALRCPAVAVVWGRLDDIHERWLRRFQLSAEQSGAMGMFVRPGHLQGQPGWAEVQWRVGNKNCHLPDKKPRRRAETKRGEGLTDREERFTGPHPPADYSRFMTIQLLRARSGQAHQQKIARLKMDFTTGTLQTVGHDAQRNQRPNTTGRQPTNIPVSATAQTTPQSQATTRKTHPLSLATQLANPKTGGRQRRA